MAVEATGSRFSRNNCLIVAVVCLVGALWFGYDGWFGDYRQEELDKNDGKPTKSLYFNMYSPIPLTLIAVFELISAVRIPSRRITAGELALELSSGENIPYDDIKRIDTRRFKTKGYFTIEYEQGDRKRQLQLADRRYDNLGVLLDEIVRRTGAAPPDAPDQDHA